MLPLALAACVGPVPGSPEACALQKVSEAAVSFDRNWPIVDVTLDGSPVRMVVDTGATNLMLTEAAAKRIGTQTDWNAPMLVSGVSGYLRMYEGRVKHLAVGDAQAEDQHFVITPVTLTSTTDRPVDGLLGGEFLSKFDVDLDLPHARMTLYRGRACPAGTPPWQEPYTALASPAVWLPTQKRVFLNVTLDSYRFTAMLDSGAQNTMVTESTATAAGTGAAALSGDRTVNVRGVTPDIHVAHVHKFDQLAIGREAFRNVTLAIGKDINSATGALIGADYLRHHRVWISYASQKMFVGATDMPRAVAATQLADPRTAGASPAGK